MLSQSNGSTASILGWNVFARIVHVPETREQRPRFVTNDADACRAYIKRHTGTHDFQLSRRSRLLSFTHHEFAIGAISLNLVHLSCTEGFTITRHHPASFYLFKLPVEGGFHFESATGLLTASPGDIVINNPKDPFREFWTRDCLQFLIHVDPILFEEAVSAELAHELSRPVKFESLVRDPGIVNWLKVMVRMFWNRGGCATVGSDRRVAKRLERMLISMLLDGLPHSESSAYRLQSWEAAPYYVKRAESFIHEHLHDDVTVEQIVAAAGVSARTLYYGFKAWRRTSPIAYVRSVKLDWVHQELLRARGSGSTVSEVAAQAGFTNFGQFGRIYKARFGETPSATLRLKVSQRAP